MPQAEPGGLRGPRSRRAG